MNTCEYISIFLAFFSVILGYAAYNQTKIANRLQDKIAQFQGVFGRPQLDILVFDKPVTSCYIYALPLNKKRAIVPLDLLISNNENIRANNVEIFINSPNEIIPPEIMKLNKTETSFKKTKFKILTRTEHKTTYGIKKKYLEQNKKLFIRFELALRYPTLDMKRSTIFTSKDNVKAEAKYSFSYFYFIQICAYSENHSSISKEIKIGFLDTSENTLIDYFKNIAIENEKLHNEKIKKFSKLQKIELILNPNSQLRPKQFDICYITSNNFVENEATPNLLNLKSVNIGFGIQKTDGLTIIPSLNMRGYPKQLK